jgi:mono/diheme cytochrome c family protein
VAALRAFVSLLCVGGLFLAGPVRAQQDKEQHRELAATTTSSAPAAPSTATPPKKAATRVAAAPVSPQQQDAARAEGEKRFSTNCGRCHQAPHRLAPRMMATAIRHMRVRATITDEDMRLILQYMTQ